MKRLKKPENKIKNYQLVILNGHNECTITKNYCALTCNSSGSNS